MPTESSESIELCRRIEQGDPSALLELFARHRDRLKRMVTIPHLKGVGFLARLEDPRVQAALHQPRPRRDTSRR
jgi:hypothetical protein